MTSTNIYESTNKCDICGGLMVGRVNAINRYHADCWLTLRDDIHYIRQEAKGKYPRNKYE